MKEECWEGDYLYRKGRVAPFEYGGLKVHELTKDDLIQLLALSLEHRGFTFEYQPNKEITKQEI